MMYNEKMLESFSKEYAERCQVTDKITAEMFDANGVLRGLRDKNGNGVVAGLTSISKIEAFRMENGQKIPCDGNLWYRGYNVIDLKRLPIYCCLVNSLPGNSCTTSVRRWQQHGICRQILREMSL